MILHLSDFLSILALIVSFIAIGWPLYMHHQSRPKLNLFLRIVTFVDKSTKKEETMLQALVINDGYRPIIISQCEYESSPNSGKGNIGIYDELKAPYGVHEIVLPAILKPADKLELNIFRAEVLLKESQDITSIYLIDSHEKKYVFPEKELKGAKEQAKNKVPI